LPAVLNLTSAIPAKQASLSALGKRLISPISASSLAAVSTIFKLRTLNN
jgi:hypothetical protein